LEAIKEQFGKSQGGYVPKTVTYPDGSKMEFLIEADGPGIKFTMPDGSYLDIYEEWDADNNDAYLGMSYKNSNGSIWNRLRVGPDGFTMQGADDNDPKKIASVEEIDKLETDIKSHEEDTDNPHEVTAAQVGLGNVDDTRDMDKPVSTAQAEAIAEAKLAIQKWLPAVNAKSELPNPSTLSPDVNYLCRVINDTTPANNGVWQFIAGADEWTYFSDNLDFVDEAELQMALADKVNKSGDSMTGDLDMNGNRIANIGDPVGAGDTATKGYVDTGLMTKQDKVSPYKGADNQAGILVDLGAEVAGGMEVLFDILYNETQSGYLKRQAHIHGQFYGDMGIRTGMVQNGNIKVPVYAFKGTAEGVGSTNTFLWIPNSATAYFPSAKVEAWTRLGTGLFEVLQAGVSTLADTPIEMLVEIAAAPSVGRPDSWPAGTEISFDNGVYGKRQLTEAETSISAFATKVVFTASGAIKLIDSGGYVEFTQGETKTLLQVGQTYYGYMSGTEPSWRQNISVGINGVTKEAWIHVNSRQDGTIEADVWVLYTK
jgi:hypothetical protein